MFCVEEFQLEFIREKELDLDLNFNSESQPEDQPKEKKVGFSPLTTRSKLKGL